MIALDLFSGAGGMSFGAKQAGINVIQAVEQDKWACATFKRNFPDVNIFNGSIESYSSKHCCGVPTIIFGGPPCQGFSTSNQKTRNKNNKANWLFTHFLRIAEDILPNWIVIENVKGFIETECGFFKRTVVEQLEAIGYRVDIEVINACEYGVPQSRSRVFIVANRLGVVFKFPKSKRTPLVTVGDAISDLPVLDNGASISWQEYKSAPTSSYAVRLRSSMSGCENNLVTRNAEFVIQRYHHIPPGGNWTSIPPDLMHNYRDHTRCHTGIYRRLSESSPSVVLGNFRKNMLIHPTENRGLSVREAARLQSFPDSFVFEGSIGFQQQQVCNAVPPFVAGSIFNAILRSCR